MTVTEGRSDARNGGSWQLAMRARDGTRFALGGNYRELKSPERLVYTWMWQGENSPMPGVETLIEVDLVERDGGTELTLRHSGFPAAAARDGHQQGWHSTLNHLVDFVDARGTAATLTLLGDVRSSYTRTVRMAPGREGPGLHVPALRTALRGRSWRSTPSAASPRCAMARSSSSRPAPSCAIWTKASAAARCCVPGSILGRARCEQWVSAVNAYLYDTMVRRYVLQYVFPRGDGGKPDRGVIDGALKEMPAQLAALDKAYGAGDWLAGGALSMADLFVAPILAYVEQMPEGAALLAAAPNVQRAQAAMRARASFTSTDPSAPPPT